jgi:predicted Zn-dependent protease
MASEADLSHIADICIDLKKPSCAIDALTQASQQQTVSQKSLFRLGKIFWQTQQATKAIAPLSAYFKRGGKELEAAFIFAQALSQTKNFEKSDEYFRFILNSKPNTLQITVTQAYVQMLKDSNQLGRALSLIKEFRKKGENTGLFMNRELKEIQQMMASR